MSKNKKDAHPVPEPTSPEVFELLDIFTEKYYPTNDVSKATRFYTTKEIIAALREYSADLKIRDADIVDYLKTHHFHCQVLPDRMGLKFHWLFIEK